MALSSVSGSQSDEGDETEGTILSEINITPLVDVMLVLLIIFMVTSSVMSQMGVDVALPKASESSASSEPDGVVVTLLPNGGLKINGIEVPANAWSLFEARLKEVLERSQSKLVVLEGDRQAFLGNAVEVMDRSKKAGALRFAIATAGE